jgi:hypothetical protein
VLASIGSVGDAFDNPLAESFVDSFKTELIADRVWPAAPALTHPTLRPAPEPSPSIFMPREAAASRDQFHRLAGMETESEGASSRANG